MKKIAGIWILLWMMCAACGKADIAIPNVPVNFSALLTDPRLLRLSSPGQGVLIKDHGVAGLIIYHKLDGSYVSYDRCSTVNPEEKCAVVLDESNFAVTDKCTGAKFSLEDGSPVKAPAKRALKMYTTSIQGNTIHVTN
ncbi:hypothetical protein [Pedobacter ginsengisoli]|uniref:hypothetical protein n=1 Tax=Pedobacter ginsengisoli TaxID=363852 RepID=UPI002549D1C2|nr:hypothetical protein [Pedobacter ginsengisoli]